MPIYNGIEFIDDSVGSILEQTYTDWELIIGINGHPINSDVYKIAKHFETVDTRIRVYDFYEIRGKANTSNKMIQYCSGDYVGILDVDDIWHEKKLELQIPFLYDYDVIGARCVYFGDINGKVPDIPTGNISEFDFKKFNPIINSSAIIKKELAWWNDIVIEDYDLFLRLWALRNKIYNVDEVLVNHRIHKNSAFNSKPHKYTMIQSNFDLLKENPRTSLFHCEY
jgi:teichuronic acid biosynthesis glycosyltransferase TuaG